MTETESRQISPRHPAQESFVRFIGSSIFISRWLQAPLYIGLIVAQAVYVVVFWKELAHLVTDFGSLSEEKVMLIVLGLVDVVMIANLLIMVIIGGYETFVSRIGMESHPDKPEWLSHVNPNVLKVKLAMSIIGISSIHLLKSFIEAGTIVDGPHGNDKLMWQTIIHMAFIASAIGLAYVDWISAKAAALNHDTTGTGDQL
ncbi:MAG: TIGR00645 family protein [Gordonia sp. (in: high G+C Gram-positive bacteria)]|uniref:TIGR00645 family protein n=1 Tax=Gordonia sp. (in: high G+C Gram-positive bacteria) TaxID=84139 RepID=UPI0039E37727